MKLNYKTLCAITIGALAAGCGDADKASVAPEPPTNTPIVVTTTTGVIITAVPQAWNATYPLAPGDADPDPEPTEPDPGPAATVTPIAVEIFGEAVLANLGEVVVHFDSGVDDAAREALAAAHGLDVIYSSALSDIAIFGLPAGLSIEDAVSTLAFEPGVVEATANPVSQGADDEMTWVDWTDGFLPADVPLYQHQWHLHQQRVAAAWEASQTLGASVKIAVLDTGVSPVSSLVNIDAVNGANFITPGGASADDHGHGTHMASIIASSGALWGVAPGATIVPVKVLDAQKRGTEAALVDGLYHAASVPGVRVISMSLTFPPGYTPSLALTDAVQHVADKGIVMVAASGNDGLRNVGYPARFPQVIAVGAARVKRGDDGALAPVRASYSNYGYALDLLAYGGDLARDANTDGLPDGILGQSMSGPSSPSGWYLTTGTSPAAAQVAGAAALLLDAGVPSQRIRHRLQHGAEDFGVATFAPTYGRGLMNVARTMPSLATGYAPAGASRRFLANPVVVLESYEDSARAVALVEVTDEMGTPLANHDVMVHFGGDVASENWGTSDASGVAVVKSSKLPIGADGLIAVVVEAVVAPGDPQPVRPIAASRVERVSYQLLSTLGTGMSSSSIILDYADDAWADNAYVDPARLVDTLTVRTLGPGRTTSPIVMAMRPDYFANHPASASAMVFRTSGTGMASSSIILDQAFFNPTLRASWGEESLLVRHFPADAPEADHAILGDSGTYALDAFFVGANPGILLMNGGSGAGGSAIIWNADMLAPNLHTGADTNNWLSETSGTGMASSSLVAPYTQQVVEQLGGSWERLQLRYTAQTSTARHTVLHHALPTALSHGLFGGQDGFSGFSVGESSATAGFECDGCIPD